MTELAVIDPSSAVAVTSYLEQAKTWLATAVEQTGPEQIARAKAEIATAAEAAKQLGLSKDIQLDAQEMVRRAEYALGRSIRLGQAGGAIRTVGDDSRVDLVDRNNYVPKASPYDYAPKDEMHGNGAGIAHLAEATPEEFEAALGAAKAEDNVSRANVVRKIKGQLGPGVVTRDMRAEMIRNLAEQGYTSRQMVSKVGVVEKGVRLIARDFGITITADKVMNGSRRIDHTGVIEKTVTALEDTVSTLQYIDFNEVEFGQADDWVASLAASISALNGFKKRIAKEATQ